MNKLDLSVLGDVVHARCNEDFFSSLLFFIQQEAEKLGITFRQQYSDTRINTLPRWVEEKLSAIFSVARYNHLYGKIELDTSLKWVKDDYLDGYAVNFLTSIFKALEKEHVYIHFVHFNNPINNENINIFIAKCFLNIGAITFDSYDKYIADLNPIDVADLDVNSILFNKYTV